MLKNRAKKAPKKAAKTPKQRDVSEQEIQMKTAQWVRKAHPRLLAFHVANERRAAVQFHVKLKRMGVLGGVADWLVFPDSGRKAAIELKDRTGKQEPAQIAFQKHWERTGGVYFLVRSLDEFKTVINGLLLFN